MSDGRAEDLNLTYSGSQEIPDTYHLYEVPQERTPNPAYGCLADKTEDSKKKKNAATSKKRVSSVSYLIVIVVAVVLLLAAGIAFVVTFVEISKLNSEIALLQSTSPKEALSIQALQSMIDQLSSTVSNNTEITEVLQTIQDIGHVYVSCADIQQLLPLSSSGYYNIMSSNGSAITVYCDMTRSCGGVTGGWIRVAELDMRDTTNQCTDNLRFMTFPLRTCTTMTSDSGSCSSDKFSVQGFQYSKVCGRIRAYQVGSPDAFGSETGNRSNIDTYYVDGISLTHGSSPRQHIWTFACAVSEQEQSPTNICPCTNTALSSMVPPPPPFVGNDYFCDTGSEIELNLQAFYAEDPLWDGAGCGPQSMCCSFNNPPWFYKQLPQATTDDIEMRVCRDEESDNEDIALDIVEIFVQ